MPGNTFMTQNQEAKGDTTQYKNEIILRAVIQFCHVTFNLKASSIKQWYQVKPDRFMSVASQGHF